jgi:hypothetical protein
MGEVWQSQIAEELGTLKLSNEDTTSIYWRNACDYRVFCDAGAFRWYFILVEG